jgi:membrane protein DedA with SNARE-associated domain
MHKLFWEALIAYVVEEAVKFLLPPLLPYVSFLILVGLSIEVLRKPWPKRILLSIAGRLRARHQFLPYLVFGITFVAMTGLYSEGVYWAIQAKKSREHQSNIEQAQELARLMPKPQRERDVEQNLPTEMLHTSDSIQVKVVRRAVR